MSKFAVFSGIGGAGVVGGVALAVATGVIDLGGGPPPPAAETPADLVAALPDGPVSNDMPGDGPDRDSELAPDSAETDVGAGPEDAKPVQSEPEAAPEMMRPRFDLVRAERGGPVLVAGSSEPGGRIEILVDGAPEADAAAGADGKFVAFLDVVISEPRVLTLRATLGDTVMESEEEILLAPPAPAPAPDLALPAAPEAPQVAAAPPEPPEDTALQVAEASQTIGQAASRDAEAESAAASDEASPPAVAVVEPELEASQSAAAAPETEMIGTPQSAADGPEIDVSEAPQLALAEPEPAANRVALGAPEPAPPAAASRLVSPQPVPPVPQRGAAPEAEPSSPPAVAAAPEDVPEAAALPDEAVSGLAPPPDDAAPAAQQPSGPVAAARDAAPEASPVAERPSGSDDAGAAPPVLAQTAAPSASAAPAAAAAAQASLRPAASADDTAPVSQPLAVTDVPAIPSPELAAPAVIRSSASGVEVLPSAPLPPGGVALDSISYSAEGAVRLAGRGSEEGFVRVYLDNAPLTVAQVEASGQWRVTLPDVDTGTYTLRVDQIDAGGAVTSRVESPFLRESAEVLAQVGAGLSGPIASVTVQPGNTLWAIARERYGEGVEYVKVFEANRDRIRNPDLIYPGQIFDLPDQ